MKQPKLVILRGKPTSGKSTAWHSLKKRKELTDWIFVDHANLKTTLGRDLGKHALFAVLKTVMPTRNNIIIEESSKQTIRKYLNYHIKKHNYKIITFQFEVSLNTAYKRNIQRAKDKWHPYIKKQELERLHEMHNQRFDKTAHLIDCNKFSKKQVVDYIIKTLKKS